ncbi:MAG TPA: hypothetical protein VFO65_04535 [Acidimicrobiales bacterium]|nr:hypothetical protein [Acidimicrobiales bacterium]
MTFGAAVARGVAGTSSAPAQAVLVVLLIVVLVEREVLRARSGYRQKAAVLDIAVVPLILAFTVVVATRAVAWL